MSYIDDIYPDVEEEEIKDSFIDRIKRKILNDETWEMIVTIGWTSVIFMVMFGVLMFGAWALLVPLIWGFFIREIGMSRKEYVRRYYKYLYRKLRVWEDELYNYETFIVHKANQVYPLKIDREDLEYIYTRTEHMNKIRDMVKQDIINRKEKINEKLEKKQSIINKNKKVRENEKKIDEIRKDIENAEEYSEELSEYLNTLENSVLKADIKINENKEKLADTNLSGDRVENIKEEIKEKRELIEDLKESIKEKKDEFNKTIDFIDESKEKIEELKEINEKEKEKEKEKNEEKEQEYEEELSKNERFIKNIDLEELETYDENEILEIYDILFGFTYSYLIRLFYSDVILNDFIIIVSPYSYSKTFHENEKMCLCDGFYFRHKRSDASAMEIGSFYDIPILYITECSGSMENLAETKRKRNQLENDIDNAKIGFVLRRYGEIAEKLQSAKLQQEALEKERDSIQSDVKLIKKRWETNYVGRVIDQNIKQLPEIETEEYIEETKSIWYYVGLTIFIIIILTLTAYILVF